MGFLDRLRIRRAGQPARSVEQETAKAEISADQHRFAVVSVRRTVSSGSPSRIAEMAVVTTDLWGRVVEEWETRLDSGAAAFIDMIPDLNERLAGAAIVAHNAEFDVAVLRAEYRRAGWKLPQVPTLSLLEISAYYLPALERRRLIDIASALGTTTAGADTALVDAHTAAALLAEFLSPKPGKPTLPEHLDGLPARAQKVVWPTGPTLEPQSATPSTHSVTPAGPGLASLLKRFSLLEALDEGAPTETIAYLEKLTETLEGGTATAQEVSGLARIASAEELTREDVGRANEAFARALTYALLNSGRVPADERSALLTTADLLGVGQPLVLNILEAAEKAQTERHAAGLTDRPADQSLGEPLRVGDKVVFTGCDPEARDELEARSQRLGVRIVGTVSETTALLVSDGSVDGTRAARARELGTRTVGPDEYVLLLNHLQPAVPRQAGTEHTAATEPASTSESRPALQAVAAQPEAALRPEDSSRVLVTEPAPTTSVAEPDLLSPVVSEPVAPQASMATESFAAEVAQEPPTVKADREPLASVARPDTAETASVESAFRPDPARRPRAARKPRASIPEGSEATSSTAKTSPPTPEAETELPSPTVQAAPAVEKNQTVRKPRTPRAKVSPATEPVVERPSTAAPKKVATRKAAAPRIEAPAVATQPRTAEVRAWARANGYQVSVRGALPKELIAAYLKAQSDS
nr:hypothetical protein [uncultured organism]